MKNLLLSEVAIFASAMIMLAASTHAEETAASSPRKRKFRRVWTFAQLRDEEFARKIAALNVQNVGGALTPEKCAIAKKYGLIPYIAGGAGGMHLQVMSQQENDVFRQLDGEPQPGRENRDGLPDEASGPLPPCAANPLHRRHARQLVRE